MKNSAHVHTEIPMPMLAALFHHDVLEGWRSGMKTEGSSVTVPVLLLRG